jgi:hypothetical protein
LQSGEIRSDRQISDFRLGANQVGGNIDVELSYTSFDQFLEAVLLSADWASPATTGTTTIDATATGFERGSGSFLTDGFAVGQTVVSSGFSGSGYNGKSVITAVDALTMTTTPYSGSHGVESGGGDEAIIAAQSIAAGTTRRSFSFIRYFADQTTGSPYHIYTGVEMNTLNMSIPANAMITGSFGTLGKGQTLAADLTGLGTPTYNAVSTTRTLDSFTGTLDEGGTTIAVITEISFSLDNGLAPRFVVGSEDSIYPSVGRSTLTGQITAYFEDSTLMTKFIDETESSITFRLPDAAGNNLRFRIPRIKYTGGQPDVSSEGPIMLTMPFQALLDSTESTNIIIERVPV